MVVCSKIDKENELTAEEESDLTITIKIPEFDEIVNNMEVPEDFGGAERYYGVWFFSTGEKLYFDMEAMNDYYKEMYPFIEYIVMI